MVNQRGLALLVAPPLLASSTLIPPSTSLSTSLSTSPPLSTSSKLSDPSFAPYIIPRGGWQRPKGSSAYSQYGSNPNPDNAGASKGSGKDDDDEDFYALLGCRKTSTEKEITRGYRKACVKHHPDKTNGDRTQFDKISKAYEVLNDPKKRKLYDKYGSRSLEPGFNPGFPGGGMNGMFGGGGMGGMQDGMFGGGSHEDILRAFFNPQQRQAPRRARDVRYNLDVSLKDLYKGAEKKVQIAKPTVNGLSELVTLKVSITRGTRGNSKIRLKGKIDHIPQAEPGDFVVVINEVEDERFQRKNDDLKTTLEVTFAESLTGFKKEIKHLDGRVVRVTYGKGVKNGDVLRIDNEGMPMKGGEFGRLYVVMDVKMGKELTGKQKRKIRKILDPEYADGEEEEETEEFTKLEDCEKDEFGADSAAGSSPFDEDSEADDPFEGSFFGQNPNHFFYQGNGFGPRNGNSNVQCAQM